VCAHLFGDLGEHRLLVLLEAIDEHAMVGVIIPGGAPLARMRDHGQSADDRPRLALRQGDGQAHQACGSGRIRHREEDAVAHDGRIPVPALRKPGERIADIVGNREHCQKASAERQSASVREGNHHGAGAGRQIWRQRVQRDLEGTGQIWLRAPQPGHRQACPENDEQVAGGGYVAQKIDDADGGNQADCSTDHERGGIGRAQTSEPRHEPGPDAHPTQGERLPRGGQHGRVHARERGDDAGQADERRSPGGKEPRGGFRHGQIRTSQFVPGDGAESHQADQRVDQRDAGQAGQDAPGDDLAGLPDLFGVIGDDLIADIGVEDQGHGREHRGQVAPHTLVYEEVTGGHQNLQGETARPSQPGDDVGGEEPEEQATEDHLRPPHLGDAEQVQQREDGHRNQGGGHNRNPRHEDPERDGEANGRKRRIEGTGQAIQRADQVGQQPVPVALPDVGERPSGYREGRGQFGVVQRNGEVQQADQHKDDHAPRTDHAGHVARQHKDLGSDSASNAEHQNFRKRKQPFQAAFGHRQASR